MAKKAFRRRKLLINPKLQWTMILFNVVLTAIVIGIFFVENQLVFSKFMEIEAGELAQDPVMMELVSNEKARIAQVFALTSAIVLITMTIGGLILSNRIAGPIYRLKKHMEDEIDGTQQGQLKFRDRDFFMEVADTYNRLLDKIKGKS